MIKVMIENKYSKVFGGKSDSEGIFYICERNCTKKTVKKRKGLISCQSSIFLEKERDTPLERTKIVF